MDGVTRNIVQDRVGKFAERFSKWGTWGLADWHIENFDPTVAPSEDIEDTEQN